MDTGMVYIIQLRQETPQMDELASKQLRRKKADKAKDKKGRPSSKHVRNYEAKKSKGK